ncbi:MAG: alpha/beta fold hydrolase, partial [Candidatus Hydrogenedens sp.]
MKQIFLPINSLIRLSIYDFGVKGPPIIFCHFTGGLGKLWKNVITPLRNNYHCFAFDARGHGDSSKPLEMKYYDWNEHLSDLIAVVKYIKKLSNSDCIFGVGHSFGSACLSQAVIKTKKYISWKKIILIEPILGPDTFDFRKSKMSEIAQKRRGYFESEKQIDTILRNKQPYRNWDIESWNIFKECGFTTNASGKYYLKCTPEIESYQYLYGNPLGWFEQL